MDFIQLYYQHKKDKEDIAIATIVVLFFLGFGYFLIDLSALSTVSESTKKVIASTSTTAENNWIVLLQKDSVKTYASIDEWAETEGEPVAEEEYYLRFKDSARLKRNNTIVPLIITEPLAFESGETAATPTIADEAAANAEISANAMPQTPENQATTSTTILAKKENFGKTPQEVLPKSLSNTSQKELPKTSQSPVKIGAETPIISEKTADLPVKQEVKPMASPMKKTDRKSVV